MSGSGESQSGVRFYRIIGRYYMHYALFDESGNDQELVPGFEIVLESAAVVDEDLGNLRESELVSV